MKKLILVMLVCCLTEGITAQPQTYLFSNIGVKNGLAQEAVSFVQQDARGFMWFGGINILQRYDGYRFLNFPIGKKSKIPGGVLMGMQFDSSNRLWLLTGNNNFGYLDADKFNYHPVNVVTPKGFENTLMALQVNKAGNVILIYIGKGFSTYNEKSNEVSVKNNSFVIPTGWEPRHVWQDDNENYWINSANGILKYNSKKKLFSYRDHNTENDPLINKFGYVTKAGFIYSNKSNIVWLSFESPRPSIVSYNYSNGEIKEWQDVISKTLNGKYYNTWGVHHFKDSSQWITGPGLFAKVNYGQHKIEPVIAEAAGASSIRYDDIGNVFEDRENNIWLCSNKGLFYFNPSAQVFKSINNRSSANDKIINSEVTGFLETRNGTLLVSTWGAGVFSYDSSLNPIPSKYMQRVKPVDHGMVWCMLESRNGDIWYGFQEGLLVKYEAATKKELRLTPELAKQKTIRQIAEDKNGNVWMGTQAGALIKWDNSTKKFTLQQQFKRLINRLFIDSRNNVWVSTDNDGVYCINSSDGRILHHYSENGPANKTLLINGALDVIEYDDSTMVISSNGLNILNTKTGEFKYWDEGTQINNMVVDKKNRLWLSTNIGIVCRNLYEKRFYSLFNERDGVGNVSFNSGAGLLLKNGHVVFGTNHDFLEFDPDRAFLFFSGLPSVEIAGISVMNKSIAVDSVRQLPELVLDYNQNSFSIQLSINCYQNITPIFYKLENVDKEWKQAEPHGEINFTYISPGTYVLKAVCQDGKGNIGAVTSIKIIITHPFYKTWWFYSLLALLISGLLFWLDKARMQRKDAIQKMRSSIADNLHEQVNTALSNINILSEMAKLKADTEPQKSKEFIEQIHSKSGNMMTAMDDMLWAISPDNDSMEKVLERLQEHTDILKNNYTVSIIMLADEKVKYLKLNMKKRQDIFWFLKSGVTNMVRTGAKEIKMHIATDKAQLIYTLEFNNSMMDMQQLNNLLQRIELENKLKDAKAKMTMHSIKNNTVIELRVPVS